MYRTPSLGAPLLVAVSGSVVAAIDRASGAVAWRHALASSNRQHRLATRVWIEDDAVILVSASELADTWVDKLSAVVTCLEYATGALRWQRTFDADHAPSTFVVSLLVDAGQVIVATNDHVLTYALADGTPLWKTALKGAPSLHRACALAVPGMAIPGDRDA